jgi:hypothetical protein
MTKRAMIVDVLVRLAACSAAAALLPGCPNPDLYTTPRTLDPGAVQVQVALEGIGASYNSTSTSTNANGQPVSTQVSESIFLPMAPTVGVRVGVADGVEVGARIPNLDSLAGDVKVRLLKGQFDLAVDPGLQGFYLSVGDASLGVMYLHLPLLVGLNLSKSVTLVASPGIAYAILTGSESGGNGSQQVAGGTSGVIGRLGFGVNLRLAKKFSIQPELTFMKAFQNDNALIYVFGLGFNIGAQPDYSDLDPSTAPALPGEAPAAPAAPAPAPASH